MKFTTVTAVDDQHVKELELTWPTWRRHKPEIVANPLHVIVDGSASAWRQRLEFIDHPDLTVIGWEPSPQDWDQREKMLTALTVLPAQYVQTPWFLKLDTDAVATGPQKWIDEGRYFNERNAFTASPWGYSKPSHVLTDLDNWGDEIAALRQYKRLNLPFSMKARSVKCRRIISWLMFVNTRWNVEHLMPLLKGPRLPVPSQDTLLWYVAARRGDRIQRVRFNKLGWKHAPSLRRIRRAIASR